MTPAAAAGTWTLGTRTVNRLGFGAMRLSGTGGMGRGLDRDPELSAEVVRRAVELGVNHIDTAAFYFSATARANSVIRAALAPYPADLTIVTKVGPGRDLVTGDWGDWLRPDQLRAHVEHNLGSLGLSRLHVVNYRSNGRAVAQAHDATPAQVRIAGTLALGPHVLAIPGTGDLAHLVQNVAAASLRLTAADLAALATLGPG